MIAEALEGKRIAVTGSTGFLGTALVERLLRSVPGCSVVLIVRPGRRGAEDRVRREILRNDCFDRLRSEVEDFDGMVAARLVTLAGDVATDGLGHIQNVQIPVPGRVLDKSFHQNFLDHSFGQRSTTTFLSV